MSAVALTWKQIFTIANSGAVASTASNLALYSTIYNNFLQFFVFLALGPFKYLLLAFQVITTLPWKLAILGSATLGGKAISASYLTAASLWVILKIGVLWAFIEGIIAFFVWIFIFLIFLIIGAAANAIVKSSNKKKIKN